MALDFPASPSVNQTYTAPNGVIWVWDGNKWANGTGASAYAPITSPVFLGNPTAPNPPAGDADTSVATTSFVAAAVAPAFNGTGRNLLHNPLFTVAQRGVGPFSGGYTLDRWQVFTTLDTAAISQVAFGPAALVADEAAAFALGNTFTGNAGATAFNFIEQPIEDVRRLSNKTVTVSFYANTGSGSLKLGVSLTQRMGTGGSPSADVVVNGQSVTVGGGYARYSLTFVVPSISGKTLGTNNNHSTWLYFWYSSGATNNTQSGNVGVQSGTIYLWGVQLEIGSVATPLEKPDPRYDLSNCQRFYAMAPSPNIYGFQGNAGDPYRNFIVFLPVTMRATPTVTATGSGFTPLLATTTPTHIVFNFNSGNTNSSYAISGWTASADL